MRTLQVVLFVAGLVVFVAALLVAGGVLGDIFWRTGVALMLADLVLMKLWPAVKMPHTT